jgi:hypothetical protein
VMVLDGFVENGIDALDQALADLSNQGLKIDVEPVDVMMG